MELNARQSALKQFNNSFNVLEEEETTLDDTNNLSERQRVLKQFNNSFDAEETEEYESIDTASAKRELVENNPELKEAAKRFTSRYLGKKDLSDKDAMDLYVEHFRKFSVNELVTAGDYNYVSGLAADAKGKTKLDAKRKKIAEQNLRDYQLLYTTFENMDSFHGGFFETLKDYGEGLAFAPSTLVGLVLPGAGKATGLAASQVAKAGVKQVLKKSLNPVAGLNALTRKTASVISAKPITTAVAFEGTAGALQNIAEQNTELAGNLRDDYNIVETALGAAAGATLAGGAVALQTKNLLRKGTESSAGSSTLLKDAQEAVIKKDKEALLKAEKVLKESEGVAEDLKSLLPSLDPKFSPLNPENVGKGREEFLKIAKEKGLDPELTASFDPSTTTRIFAMGVDMIKKAGIEVAKDVRITEQIADAVRQIKIKEGDEGTAKFTQELFNKYNLTGDDFANMFMADISDAARKLQSASMIRKITSAADDTIFSVPEQTKKVISDASDDLEKGDIRTGLDKLRVEDEKVLKEAGDRSFVEKLRRADTLRRAAMTSMTATTIRNNISGVSRVGIDTLTRAFDVGISKGLYKVSGGRYGFDKINVQDGIGTDIFATIYGNLNKAETDAVSEIFKSSFDKKATRLFRELQDLDASGVIPESKKIDAMTTLARDLNVLNTASDNIFKRVSFVSGLKRALNDKYTADVRAGKAKPKEEYNLTNIIRDGNFKSVFNSDEGKAMLDKVIDDSLYFTYQQSPNLKTSGGKLADMFIRASNSVPFVTSSLMPFPRFVANALRFTYEYSPAYLLDAGFVRFATKNQNSYEELSKGLVGTGLLYGAMAFRDSEYAGEKWYHARLPDGSNFDMRPFFPAAPYLFFADLANKALPKALTGSESSDDPIFGDSNLIVDALQALSGTQLRAGSGLYALDKAVEDLAGAKDDPSKVLLIANNLASNIVSTYTIPLTAGQDLYNSFLAPDDERIVRESKRSLEPGKRIENLTSLFLQKSLARVPGNRYLEDVLAEKLGVEPSEIYQPPTKSGVIRRDTPITRQAFGILKQGKPNFFEEELDRLKISRRKLYTPTGVPEADIILKDTLGEYVEDFVIPSIKNDPEYKDASTAIQVKKITEAISQHKKYIIDSVKKKARTAEGNQELQKRFGFNPVEKLSFSNKENWAKQSAISLYQQRHPNWKNDGYDYEELDFYAKYFTDIGVDETAKQMKKGGN